MATINKNIMSKSDDEILAISEHFLKGWHDLNKEYGFRVQGLNHRRETLGLKPLDKNMSLDYRVKYIMEHYTATEIYDTIAKFLCSIRVADERWKGIELFGCRFGRDYAKAFRRLLGSAVYRKLSEETRIRKLEETQLTLYGGIGLGGHAAKSKAYNTNIEKYGTFNPMKSKVVQERLTQTNSTKYGGMSPFSSAEVRQKATLSRNAVAYSQLEQFAKDGIVENVTCFKSVGEMIMFRELVNKFGKNDVFFQYGVHPFDKRYPYNCDFYIKSFDLFIELNAHYCHHTHWFDSTNHDDVLRRDNILTYGKKRSKDSLRVWCGTDVKKRETARRNNLNFLVFWDSSRTQVNGGFVPNLKDFYLWMDSYSCNTAAFLKDHPENTY